MSGYGYCSRHPRPPARGRKTEDERRRTKVASLRPLLSQTNRKTQTVLADRLSLCCSVIRRCSRCAGRAEALADIACATSSFYAVEKRPKPLALRTSDCARQSRSQTLIRKPDTSTFAGEAAWYPYRRPCISE